MKAKATKQPKLTKLELKIKKLNAAYKKATPAQRRVMIAKDALEQIKRKTIIPEEGTYVSGYDGRVTNATPLQPLLLDETNPLRCDCCAKGALFISCVRLSNRFEGSPFGIGSDDINEIVNWPKNNYRQIEVVFEGFDSGSSMEENEMVAKWCQQYDQPTPRLQAILTNIIRNKGTFKINDL